METDDYFAKMMFSNINNEVYFDNCDDYTGASEYGMGSILSDKTFLNQRKSSHSSVVAGQKSEHITKYNQFILATSETNEGGSVTYEEVGYLTFLFRIIHFYFQGKSYT